MASIILAGSTSGSITISSPSVSGSNTLTLPANTGTVITTGSTFAGTGPAFSAYRTGTQGGFANNTYTKISVQTEVFDTNSNYDNATNYRFIPTVAGYYQFNAAVVATGTNLNYLQAVLVKNGSAPGFTGSYATTASGEGGSHVSTLIYLNGSTDYVELYAYAQVTGTFTVYGGAQPQAQTFFNGSLVRSA